jgi:formate dehydrogenase subunit delta
VSTKRLISMVNQIARFFESQPGGQTAEQTANHLKSFWDPRMRADLVRHLQAGGAGLTPIATAAAVLLDQSATQHAARAPSAGTGHDAN